MRLASIVIWGYLLQNVQACVGTDCSKHFILE
jgi:hypothetical protein